MSYLSKEIHTTMLLHRSMGWGRPGTPPIIIIITIIVINDVDNNNYAQNDIYGVIIYSAKPY